MCNLRYVLAENNSTNRRSVIQSISRDIEALPEDEPFLVTVTKKEKGRRVAQNALNWVWVAQTADFYGENAEYMHGLNKCKILYPMMCSLAEYREDATLFRDAVRTLENPEHAYWLADRCLRTRALSIRHFSTHLSLMQDFWAEKGLVLTQQVDEYEEAMRR